VAKVALNELEAQTGKKVVTAGNAKENLSENTENRMLEIRKPNE
jgi:hypothetical protein